MDHLINEAQQSSNSGQLSRLNEAAKKFRADKNINNDSQESLYASAFVSTQDVVVNAISKCVQKRGGHGFVAESMSNNIPFSWAHELEGKDTVFVEKRIQDRMDWNRHDPKLSSNAPEWQHELSTSLLVLKRTNLVTGKFQEKIKATCPEELSLEFAEKMVFAVQHENMVLNEITLIDAKITAGISAPSDFLDVSSKIVDETSGKITEIIEADFVLQKELTYPDFVKRIKEFQPELDSRKMEILKTNYPTTYLYVLASQEMQNLIKKALIDDINIDSINIDARLAEDLDVEDMKTITILMRYMIGNVNVEVGSLSEDLQKFASDIINYQETVKNPYHEDDTV